MATTRRPVGLPPLRERAREQAPIWFAFLGGAAAWGVRIAVSYLLVPRVCASDRTFLLHGVAVGTLLVAVAAAVVGYRVMTDARRRRRDAGDVDAWERTEFLGLAGAFMSAFFAGVIVLESTANFIIDPCAAAGL